MGLYRSEFEHASCGTGFVARVSGKPDHSILKMAIESVVNLTHRGAVSADGKSGDGAGVMTQLPVKLFQRELEARGLRPPAGPRGLAAAVLFLPGQDTQARERARRIAGDAVAAQGLRPLLWRDVPVDPSALGESAARAAPHIVHLLVERPPDMPQDAFTRALYLARKRMEARAVSERVDDFYVPSFSDRTIVYKGLLVATQLERFYLDLQDPDFETALAVFHQRYSTNTFPSWRLAHPYRFLAHNGEINTLQGNRNWMRAREPELASESLGKGVADILPVIQPGGSDSANLDNVLEALIASGRDILHAMTMLVPEAWENMPDLPPEWRSFYQYHACVTEPWDGPAAISFSDGRIAGAILDRNGLRPARYKVTDNGIVSMASEAGVLALDDAHVVEKGRLGPGQMIAVDTERHLILKNGDIKEMLARAKPYGEWVSRYMVSLSGLVGTGHGATATAEGRDDLKLERAFGYTSEEMNLVMAPMAVKGVEPLGSMGDDTPLAVLATKPRLLYSYFKQRFAQVTNPPIDYLREYIVTSLHTYMGARKSLLEETPEHARLLFHDSPVLTDAELAAVMRLDRPELRARVISCLFPVAGGPEGLKPALERVCHEAERAVRAGATLLVLSDRGVDRDNAPIPMLMAVGGVHHHLIRRGLRMKASIVAETGEAREVHQICCLIGYGASAVNPYLGFQSLRHLVAEGAYPGLTWEKACDTYKHTLEKQVLKVMSKMGISAVSAYHGGQVFEAIGIGNEVIEACFAGTVSPIGGLGFVEIAKEVLARHQLGYFDERDKLEDYGYYRFRKEGEPHAYNPFMWRAMHKAIESGAAEDYDKYVKEARSLPPIYLRDLLDFVPAGPAIPVDQVEPAREIVQRFMTGSMSLGALSPEAHETLAMAMNALGARSNTGEGGEDPRRYRGKKGEYSLNSSGKQVASGRFGVTPEYLASARELEIKMAQGSKPGEGGQLPGHKVVDYIARFRHTQPGVTLISPPPHHDIYSIEDLSQLIYDLKQANPRARVSVKLVSEAGVGTIAAGVAKGYADLVHVSGMEGGTGASPLLSIKNAGTPWELGVAETQQTLVMNDLRGRVVLRTDGGMRTAKDLLVAALLGAEEFSFGTAALVAIGCTMARQCHLNTCPTGIATQDPKLREKFKGTPEGAIRFFFMVAEELRRLMASLGIQKLDDVVGRPELLRQIEAPGHPKANTLDLSPILTQVDPDGRKPRRCATYRNDRPGDIPLDNFLMRYVQPALQGIGPVKFECQIDNIHRAVGTRVSGYIAHEHGDAGLPDGTIEITFRGSAGQSFGAFLTPGFRLTLLGEANDYVGKGMAGGEIVVRPSERARFAPHENVIAGNTALYGATAGNLYVAGKAGERFAVRNSGAWAVVEGTGDHCCEYMTGGVVAVLGETGRNFGAGMSGGVAYVLDENGAFERSLNTEMVEASPVEDPHDVAVLHTLVQQHARLTGSQRAKDVLGRWDEMVKCFRRVAAKATVAPPPPREEQRARRDALLAQAKGQGR